MAEGGMGQVVESWWPSALQCAGLAPPLIRNFGHGYWWDAPLVFICMP